MDEILSTILYVGEDLNYSGSLKSMLDQNFKLVLDSRGTDALIDIREQHPDLILINPNMRDSDKMELFNWLIDNGQSLQIPILLMVDPGMADFWKNLYCNVANIIYEPTDPEIIVKRLREYLEQKQYNFLVANSTKTDPLTGLYTRSHLMNLLSTEWRRAIRHQSPISLIAADIDFFSSYNDLYGSSAGDDALIQIAAALTKCVKREIDCVARFGPDEFACLLVDTDILGAVHVANLICDTLDDLQIPHAASPVADNLTMSFGVATLKPSTRFCFDLLIQQGEKLLTDAKLTGHNRIVIRKN